MHIYLHILFVRYYDVAESFLLNKSTKDTEETTQLFIATIYYQKYLI